MKKETIRTSLDIPRELHRRLREAAARRGCSARQLVLQGVRIAVEGDSPRPPRKRLSLEPAIVPWRGKPFNLTSEQIHDLIEFP
jgi:hypothetical protein